MVHITLTGVSLRRGGEVLGEAEGDAAARDFKSPESWGKPALDRLGTKTQEWPRTYDCSPEQRAEQLDDYGFTPDATMMWLAPLRRRLTSSSS